MSFEQKVQLSITVLLAGLVIVFIMLIFLTYLIKGYGAVIKNLTPKNHNETLTAPAPAPVAVARTNRHNMDDVAQAAIPEEVVAAISAAVYTMYGTSGVSIKSIRRAPQSSRSAWSMAGLLENTRPF